MKKIPFFLFAFAFATNLQAQSTEKWSLRKCVDYAMKNNISVKQADIQARIAALQLQQAKFYQLPNAIFSTSFGPSFGRSIDNTNTYVSANSFSQNIGLQGSVDIYNFGKLKNNVAANQFSAKAALADIEKAANDVALSVATYYLQVIAAYQQINIAQVQIQQTTNNLETTRKKVDAGSLPELNALEFESQLATDSTNYVAAATNYSQTLLALKGTLNLDAALYFDVEIPDVTTIPLENLTALQPENVYKLAIDNQPAIKANKLRINSSEKNVLASKASMYPNISSNYSLGTNFFDVLKTTPFKTAYPTQLDNNFKQSVGVNIAVPIFNNGTNRINYEQSKLSLQNSKTTEEQIEQKLKLDIYTAYSNATNALQKFNASKKQLDVAQKAFDFANKRYEVGLLNTLDLITNQNNLLKAKTQHLTDQYDYVFKMKLLEFYKGQGLKL
jgi:outer membrane protein